MKGHLDRTKVVLRHLPPSITQGMLMDQIDTAFGGRYNWFSFRPGKSSLKNQVYSRAYINLNRPEDVIEFAEFFEGHVFVNEKGAQFKTIVEYAPSQRMPKQTSKKDGREGTIMKDPGYLEFLEFIAKPVENLPSAEIQLERREAERSGIGKEAPVVTPLMDYIRQKRASKGGSRRSIANEKMSGRGGRSSTRNSSSAPSKRSSEKRKSSTAMYILRDASRGSSGKEKSTYVLSSKRDDPQLTDKANPSVVASGGGQQEDDNGTIGIGIAGAGKKKILLLKGKEREISHVSGGVSQEHCQLKDVIGSATDKQKQRHEGGRIIRTILLNKDARHNQSGVPSETQTQNLHPGKERRPPRAPSVQAVSKDTNGAPDEKVHGNGLSGFGSEKLERRARNKDRPDRGVWAPLRRLDGSHASDSSFSAAAAHSTLDSPEGFRKSVGRRGPSQGGKDNDGLPLTSELKSSKRGSASGYSSHEKQVWVQKSSSGS
ncbi:Smg4_UPF3 domain-containing protein [Psidium guajava]|nr:Smg4_UPF3 domain-containing protein [Psidium guajava]